MRRQNNNYKKGGAGSETPAKETDPLLEAPSYLRSTQGSSTRSRRTNSRSPHPMNHSTTQEPNGEFDSYQSVTDYPNQWPHNNSNDTSVGSSKGSGHYTPGSRSVHSVKKQQSPSDGEGSDRDQGPLLEVPEHIYAVRKGALSVLKPLTKTWVRT